MNIASPDYYPAQLSFPGKQVEFFRMSREAYRDSPFLDHRIVRCGDESRSLPFADIPAINANTPRVAAHYIFHNAFCSSTVLTRYLDALNGPLVLREPNILYELATIRRFENTSMARPLQDVSWQDLHCFVRLMIERRYDAALPTLIKPTDGCNYLMVGLVNACDGNRGLFVYSTLEHFLVSVLRFGQRHEWAKTRVQELLLDKLRETGAVPVNPNALSPAQAAALVWVLHTDQYIASTQIGPERRFGSLSSEQIAADPEGCLSAICEHFRLSYTQEEVRRAVDSTRTDVNAKAGNERFDPEQRRREYAAARDTWKTEIEQAITWVSRLHPDRDLSSPLPDPLQERSPDRE